jgi:hypothetical protein
MREYLGRLVAASVEPIVTRKTNGLKIAYVIGKVRPFLDRLKMVDDIHFPGHILGIA